MERDSGEKVYKRVEWDEANFPRNIGKRSEQAERLNVAVKRY